MVQTNVKSCQKDLMFELMLASLQISGKFLKISPQSKTFIFL